MSDTARTVEDFRPVETLQVVQMWRESFEYAIGVKDPHLIDDQIAYFRDEVMARNQLRVVKSAGQIVAFMASNAEAIAQLYVRVGHHRRGIGRLLLDLAKHESSGSLSLFTFARNTIACDFYESQGFVASQRGFEATWQLEDVRYVWRRPSSAPPPEHWQA